MALINCPECGKEISDKAASCPNCGNPMNCPTTVSEKKTESYLCCPKCGSRELHAEQKGFSGGKALVGAVAVGGLGLLAGTIGSKDVQITCLKCGNKFNAGEAKTAYDFSNTNALLNQVKELILKGSEDFDYYLEAKRLYLTLPGKTEQDFEKFGDEFVKEIDASPELQEKQNYYAHQATLKRNNGGCASVIILLIVFSLFVTAFI